METPIRDFVRRYADAAPVRAHMPGHKGRGTAAARRDITEIPGADLLYRADGIIRASEENAARLFGAARTLYSAEGSSLAIRAMLWLALRDAAGRGGRARILAGRNAHRSFITTAALLDLDVDWLMPPDGSDYLACPVDATALDARLSAARPTAVYVTSPDYLGRTLDLAALAAVCHRHGVPLLVDNAHGAYLRFLDDDRHPMTAGADLCCDSAHKTLPVLTGGAYLHISPHAPARYAAEAESAMALFASTSPSYLILQSLDEANPILAGRFRTDLRRAAARVRSLREGLNAQGFITVGDEPMKLTLACRAYGYTGTEAAERLAAAGVVCEFADPDFLVLMLGASHTARDFARIEGALDALPRRPALPAPPVRLAPPVRVLSPHDALLAPSRVCPAAESAGLVLTDPAVSCPPAVPIVSCGERIAPDAVSLFAYYGVSAVTVLDR